MALLDLNIVDENERFRAQLASVAPDGRRKWVYAKKPGGTFYRWRTALSILLLAFLAAAPFVKVGGQQFLLLGLLDRKFVLFGYPLWPEDFYLVVVLFLTGLISIVLFTSVLGRIWCGWLCPQTVFMEMIFRKIEWLIDGSAGEQLTRHRGKWNFSRVWRLVVKQSIFFVISFAIANIFLAYVISGDTLKGYITEGPSAHLSLLLALIAFTFVFYAVFARFREQACLVVCPYGRFMSALVDDNTVTITYDQKRGEPRSKWKKNDPRGTTPQPPPIPLRSIGGGVGDCIDCHQCVAVCPTGIDIRNGIQLECVACTACIDACDEIMEKVKLPKGLIRYTSANALQTGITKWFTPRVKAYGSIWFALVLVTIGLFTFRSTLDINVLRSPGTTWTFTSDGIANFYELQIINKSGRDLPYSLTIAQPAGATLTSLGLATDVPAGQMIKGRFLITMPQRLITATSNRKVDILLNVASGDKIVKQVKTELLTP